MADDSPGQTATKTLEYVAWFGLGLFGLVGGSGFLCGFVSD